MSNFVASNMQRFSLMLDEVALELILRILGKVALSVSEPIKVCVCVWCMFVLNLCVCCETHESVSHRLSGRAVRVAADGENM